jgi:hypothetical protein
LESGEWVRGVWVRDDGGHGDHVRIGRLAHPDLHMISR